jgi:signal transduction histidine kinase
MADAHRAFGSTVRGVSRTDRVIARVTARGGDVACLLVALVVGGLATDSTDVADGSYAAVNDIVGIVAMISLWWRRRAPLAVAGLTFAAAVVSPLAAGAAFVSVFTVAAYRPARIAAVATGVQVVSMTGGSILFPDKTLGAVRGTLVGLLFTFGALGWGLASRSRQQLMESLAERARRAEEEQHARVVEARRAERTRIATEMHDVLAHRLSMLSLHAGALEFRPESAPEDLARSAGVVRSNAHLALDELRMVIGVLRDDAAADLALQPTSNDLDALIEECRAARMRIDVGGDIVDAGAVPADLGRHAYRIVQEGLTNARKHAPDAPVQLSVSGQPGDGLDIDITNPSGRRSDNPIPGAGVGLVGLRERVQLIGGTLESGIDSTGTHRLHVRLPWPT